MIDQWTVVYSTKQTLRLEPFRPDWWHLTSGGLWMPDWEKTTLGVWVWHESWHRMEYGWMYPAKLEEDYIVCESVLMPDLSKMQKANYEQKANYDWWKSYGTITNTVSGIRR
jgi:hypothetical protein